MGDNKAKHVWDAFIMVLLMFVTISLPVRLAFYESDDFTWKIINSFVDICFGIDLILSFFSSYVDSVSQIEVTDKKHIAINYFKTWFFPDLLSIVPLELFLAVGSGKANQFAKIARISKLYKLVRMTRMIRFLKLVKNRNQISSNLDRLLSISAGLERLSFFVLIFILYIHCTACLFIFATQFVTPGTNTWIDIEVGDAVDRNEISSIEAGLSKLQLYSISVYFIVTTTTTVGYGDITPVNRVERGFCSVNMVLGVLAFTFASGSLSSILANYD